VRGLDGRLVATGVLSVVVISVTLIVVRIAFLFVAAYTIRAVDRRPQQRFRRVSDRARILSGLSGFRGAVSLAAALGVPLVLTTGNDFPDRDMIVFVTSGVIVVTLVVQGLLLPAVVRWASLPEDTGVVEERRLAETTAAEEALDALAEVARDLEVDQEVEDRAREEQEAHLRVVEAGDVSAEEDADVRRDQQYRELRLELLHRKRGTVVRLRDEGRIDDTVLRQVQARLDAEEVRLAPGEMSD